MKLLNNLFAFNDQQQQTRSPETSVIFTSSLYSVTFSTKSNAVKLNNNPDQKQALTRSSKLKESIRSNLKSDDNKRTSYSNSLLSNWLSRTKNISNNNISSHSANKLQPFEESLSFDEDWIVVDSKVANSSKENFILDSSSKPHKLDQLEKMEPTSQSDELTSQDVDLIKLSWSPCKKDPTDAGILLFKG